MRPLVLLLFSGTGAVFPLCAQDTTDYYASGYLRYENFVYNKNIRTVVLEQANLRLSDPVIELNRPEKLILSFDDLEGDYKNYMYTLIHCDAGWNPSSLLQNEYLSGFTEDRIINYRTSFNTLQPYTHYEQEIPGREVHPILSGNYLVKVYVEGVPEVPVLTRRMMVLQTRITIEATVHRATIVSDMDTKQEIDFSIFYPGLQVVNPFEDIKVVIQQNSRWDNVISGLRPLFLKDNELDYNYEEENTFNGGNEFRTFDIRTLRMQTQFVQNIIRTETGFTVVLTTDQSRSFGRYVTENDINGKFLVKTQDGRDNDLEGEYATVKFTLKHEILTNGNFYVFGALSDWRMNPHNKMVYNDDEERYEALLFLKQGYYDYQYVFVPDGALIADETIVEGSHYETENEYNIFVYYKSLGSRYDQLVGFKKLDSR
ncbi:MAG: DUF5103 domain-containing protein [Bacteroidota bacterium]|nr:DUF5103 domain-containing protein [Bacteroidota bacterium]